MTKPTTSQLRNRMDAANKSALESMRRATSIAFELPRPSNAMTPIRYNRAAAEAKYIAADHTPGVLDARNATLSRHEEIHI